VHIYNKIAQLSVALVLLTRTNFLSGLFRAVLLHSGRSATHGC